MDQSIRDAINYHRQALAEFEMNAPAVLSGIAQNIIECYHEGGTVYLCGNGGSAADSQHIAAELVGRFRRERRGLSAVALTTDTSILTSLGNDYGYERIFARQVEALVWPHDTLWVFSTSGTSENIIAAVETAREIGASVISFTGKSNTPLEKMSDWCYCANTEWTSTAQEMHALAYHIICDLVEAEISRD